MSAQYVIVGNGPAGLAAAEAIRTHDVGGDILILGDERVAFYSRPGLAYLLTGTLPERQLFSRSEQEYRRLRVRREVGRVTEIRRQEHVVAVEGGRVVPYDRLLLAIGAEAARPDLPGIDLPGVVTLDNLADARLILREARRARRGVVVGGGITAVELAEGLASQGVETHYLLRKDRYWGAVLDREESALIETRLQEEGICLHRKAEIKVIEGRRGRVSGVELKDGRRLPCDLLAVAIGIRPRVGLARAAGLEIGRGIWTDEYLRTSDPDIFAAGDAAEVLEPDTGVRVLDSLWSTAIQQGRCAGANMAGAGEPHRREVPFNVTRVGGVTVTLMGAIGADGRDEDLVAIARGDSEGWRARSDALVLEAGAELSRVRVLVGERCLVGAVVMGDQTWSLPLQHLITRRVDIGGVRERLLRAPERMLTVLDQLWGDVERAA